MTTILGPDGKPLDRRAVMRGIEEPQTAQLGSIRREFDKHPARGLTPAKLASIMKRAEDGDLVSQLELTDDMEERDAHIYAELGKRRGAITALAWSIEEPKNASAEEKSLTAQVRDWVDMLTAHANGVHGGMEILMGAMTAAVLPGFAPIEMTWNLLPDGSGRKVRVPDCTLQPQRWFTTSPDGRRFLLRSETKMTPPEHGLAGKMGEELRPLAWLMHVHPARNGYLARMSLARVLFWPYLFKNFAVRDLAEFLEIYGLPLRLGKYPAGASDDEKLTLLRAVTDIGHNAAGIIPQGMSMEFEAAAEGADGPFGAMWDRMDAAESKAILGQTLSASEGQKGSHALGKVHEGVRMDIRAADAELYEGSFTRQVIGAMCMLNAPGANMRRLPRLVIDTGEAEDMAAYATSLTPLAKGGMRIPLRWVHDKLRIPEAEEGEAVFEAPEPPTVVAPGAVGQPGKPPKPGDKAKRAELATLVAALLAGTAGQKQPPRDLIDQLVDEQSAEWQPLLGPMVEPLLAAIDKAVSAGESLEAFAARLPELVMEMDAQPITQALARAAFSARLAGEAGLDLLSGLPTSSLSDA